ncbi:MAG: maleylpyruvate isomerase N-terminal domain-containing protein, partial [Acidimicrobiales bacterium]
MASHKERLAAASDAIEFICSRDPDEMSTVVPNCPGWTVYNVAAHIGRVGLAWHSMIDASPDDPDSRARGYADAESRGSGHSPKVLASWVRGAVEA